MEQLKLSSSAFRDAATCLKKYEYRWVDGIVPIPQRQSEALRKGLWLHRALELHDHGEHWKAEVDHMAAWAVEHGVDEAKAWDLAALVDRIASEYVRYWDNMEHAYHDRWTLVSTETELEFEPSPGVKLTATVDCLKRDQRGDLWIWERKCLGDIPDSDWRCVDPQTMLQLVLLKTREPVKGVVFDYVWTKEPPRLRVKKDGMLYAGDDEKQTTAMRLAEALPEIRANWTHHLDFNGPNDYVGWLYGRVVADGLWFQRYPTLRSNEHLIENMQDVADTVRAVETAQKRGHYRRAWHPLTCPRFCPYMRLCASEFQLGRRNETLRSTLFTEATQDMWDQGRSQEEAIAS